MSGDEPRHPEPSTGPRAEGTTGADDSGPPAADPQGSHGWLAAVPIALPRGLLLFWSAWWTVVLLTNGADGLRALGVLHPDTPVASGNFALVARALETYALPRPVAGVLFAGILALEVAIAGAFWRAALAGGLRSAPALPLARGAFVAGTGLVAAFVLADEVFLLYDSIPGLEGTHWRLFLAHLVSLLALEHLASPAREGGLR